MRRGESGDHGVFVGAHAVSTGVLSRRQLQNGPWVRVLHGIYADPSVPRDHLLRCRAAALLMPPGAAIGGSSAAGLLGAPAPRYADPVTVIVPPRLRWVGPKGVRVHRTGLEQTETTLAADLPVTRPRRTAWDVAALEPLTTAVGVLDAMARAELVARQALLGDVYDNSRRWGARKARRAFELIDPRTESPPESWVRVACALAGLPPPVPQYEIWVDGVFLARGDLVWPEAKLIVEYEGEYHFADGQIVRDDARIARLVAAGWRVIRIAAHDLRSMDDVVRRISEALGAGPATA